MVIVLVVEVEVSFRGLFMPEAPSKGSQLDEETFCSDTTASSGLLPPTMGKVSGCVHTPSSTTGTSAAWLQSNGERSL